MYPTIETVKTTIKRHAIAYAMASDFLLFVSTGDGL